MKSKQKDDFYKKLLFTTIVVTALGLTALLMLQTVRISNLESAVQKVQTN